MGGGAKGRRERWDRMGCLCVCVWGGTRKGDINTGDQTGDVKELGRVEHRRYGGGE